MNLTIKYDTIINLPIHFVFYVFPFISIFVGHRVNYEPFWILLFLIFPFLAIRRNIKKRKFIYIMLFIWVVILKYLCPLFFYYDQLVFKPYFIEIKWIIYIFLAINWCIFIGYPNKNNIYNGGKFFAIVYIIYSILICIVNGHYERVGILNEANYDGFLFLIPFCFIFDKKIKKLDFFIFLFATFMTGSRTGCMAIIAITMFYKFRKHFVLLLLSTPILLICLIIILRLRDSGNIENIDRYIFFYQAYLYFESTSFSNIILGLSPGAPMQMNIIPEFEWYIDNFNKINNIQGVYPFYFHSAFIRLAIIWGIPLVLILVIGLIYIFFQTKYYPLKTLILLILLQSISLASHSLTNVSFILFITFIVMKHNTYKNDY